MVDPSSRVTGTCRQRRCRSRCSTAMHPPCCRSWARPQRRNSTGHRSNPNRNWFPRCNRAPQAGDYIVPFLKARRRSAVHMWAFHRAPSRRSSGYRLLWCDTPSRYCSRGCSRTHCPLVANSSIRRRRTPDSRAQSPDRRRTLCRPSAFRTRADLRGIPRVRLRTNTPRQ